MQKKDPIGVVSEHIGVKFFLIQINEEAIEFLDLDQPSHSMHEDSQRFFTAFLRSIH